MYASHTYRLGVSPETGRSTVCLYRGILDESLISEIPPARFLDDATLVLHLHPFREHLFSQIHRLLSQAIEHYVPILKHSFPF